MKPGTPGFIGACLREAREARGMSAIALADVIGVSRQAVSQYENGSGSPGPDVMQRITDKLNLPPQYFKRPLVNADSITIFYRSMSAATKNARIRGERRNQWLREIVRYVADFIELPAVNFPAFDLPAEPSVISTDEIEDIASRIRRYWRIGDGKISNVIWLLENNGVIVARDELGADTLDAFSAWVNGIPYVVLGSDKGSAVRSRFDAAHELGHLLLHRRISGTRLSRSADFRVIEDQAHRFAGAFLLPEATFVDDLYFVTLDELRSLKPKWGVSIGMMIHRAEDLGIISPDHARRLWISYGRRGWRRREPLDDELPLEQPRLLRRAFELMIEEAVQSRAEIVSSLPFATTDIEELVCLPRGYLGDEPPSMRLLNPAFGRRGNHREVSGPGDILHFPRSHDRD